jgi:hypothetical protein
MTWSEVFSAACYLAYTCSKERVHSEILRGVYPELLRCTRTVRAGIANGLRMTPGWVAQIFKLQLLPFGQLAKLWLSSAGLISICSSG